MSRTFHDCYDEATLQAYCDQEAEPAESAAIEAHLTACPACARWVDVLAARGRFVMAAMDGLGEVAPRPQTASVPSLWVGAASGALAAVLAGLFFVMHPNWARPQRVPVAAADYWVFTPTGETFIPLAGAEPVRNGTITQIEIPLPALDPAADPASPVRVKADVILGEDGTPRAYHLIN